TQGTLALTANYELTFEGAVLEITPSIELEIILADGSFVYDGTAKSLAIAGELPAGTSVSYENNGRTEVGSQQVTATIIGGSHEMLVLTATLTIIPAGQTITFNAPAEVTHGSGSIQLEVSASSGLPVTLTVDDGQVATVEGTTLHIHRRGTVRVTATQAGDGNYEAAEPVTVTLRVVDPSSDFAVRVHPAVSPNGDGINEFLMIEGIRDYPENRVTVITKNGTVVYEASGYDNSNVVFRGRGTGGIHLAAGTYFYIVEVKANGRWEHRKGYFVLRY